MPINSDRSETYRVTLDLKNKNDARVIGYSYVKPNTKVLDVGCACGDFGNLIKQNKNCEVYGLEYDAKSIEIAEGLKCYTKIDQVDLNNFNHASFNSYYEQFDHIILLDVLEHLLQPEMAIEHLKHFLKPNGSFIISLPNIAHCSIKANLLLNNFEYKDTGIMDKTHLKFFTYKSIASMLGKSLLKIDIKNVVLSDNYFIPKGQKRAMFYLSKFLIKRSPHSYVYQYVTESTFSNIKRENLIKKNIHQLQISRLMVNKWLLISFLKRVKSVLFTFKTKFEKK